MNGLYQNILWTFVNITLALVQWLIFNNNRKLLKKINQATTRQRKEFSEAFDAIVKITFDHEKD